MEETHHFSNFLSVKETFQNKVRSPLAHSSELSTSGKGLGSGRKVKGFQDFVPDRKEKEKTFHNPRLDGKKGVLSCQMGVEGMLVRLAHTLGLVFWKRDEGGKFKGDCSKVGLAGPNQAHEDSVIDPDHEDIEGGFKSASEDLVGGPIREKVKVD
ncbi:hypothetical protein QYF36_019256 [Acer negundo]|nr:hypothetical protein QYF36_019256 [Acer negundo]